MEKIPLCPRKLQDLIEKETAQMYKDAEYRQAFINEYFRLMLDTAADIDGLERLHCLQALIQHEQNRPYMEGYLAALRQLLNTLNTRN